MQSLIIPASKSLTVTNKLPNGNINVDVISIGGADGFIYGSYLFFDISSIPANVSILSAELVLLKTNNFYKGSSKEIHVYPLRDYFSTYTTFNNRPNVYPDIIKRLNPITSKAAVTLDVTSFAELWASNKLATTGIALFSKENSILSEFGSSISKDNYLIPFIKVIVTPVIPTYIFKYCCEHKDGHPCPDHREVITDEVRVIGTVAADSVYESVVRVGVTRAGTGNTDYYYVADEFDNSASYYDLPVDKTYNIAILPKIEPGDTESYKLFGSYKG